MVLSIETRAIRQDTMRFTAMGGVNWPIAIFMVRITPNQVRSHWKALAIGISTGSRIRKDRDAVEEHADEDEGHHQQRDGAVFAEAQPHDPGRHRLHKPERRGGPGEDRGERDDDEDDRRDLAASTSIS
jgi:hypothetical protein